MIIETEDYTTYIIKKEPKTKFHFLIMKILMEKSGESTVYVMLAECVKTE
jgi:hypothetical protein